MMRSLPTRLAKRLTRLSGLLPSGPALRLEAAALLLATYRQGGKICFIFPTRLIRQPSLALKQAAQIGGLSGVL